MEELAAEILGAESDMISRAGLHHALRDRI
jgi:hypothetical protein